MEVTRKGRSAMVELLIAFLFFAISSVIILQVFAAGYSTSRDSTQRAQALTTAQGWAERLYAAQDIDALLAAEGWQHGQDEYLLTADDVTYSVAFAWEESAGGKLLCAQIAASNAAETLFTLPLARYVGEATP